MVAAWIIQLIIAVVMLVVSYAMMPRPKQPKPEAATQADNPVAEAGKEMGVLFGTLTIKEANVLDFNDKYVRTYQVKA